jgi:L-fuculose-phosphate aldolase
VSRKSAQVLRREIVQYAHKVYAKGWVANHDGNLSVRLGPNRILVTPTAMSKGDIKEGDLVVVNDAGEKVSGKRRSFSEMALHNAVYGHRQDVQAVVHAHPPFATAMSVAGMGIDKPILAEAVVSLGARIPLVPFAMPKTPAWTQGVAQGCQTADALILENHGVIAYGDSLEQAFLRLELVEHLATIMHHSMAFGGPRTLDDAHVAPLLAARRKAGLGPVVRGIVPSASPTPAPALGTPRPNAPRPRLDVDQIAALVVEELARMKG